jgi:O-antigen/teichoic acid export membrane protein
MNILHITGTTLRYGVGVAVLSLFPSLTAFFLAQVIVSGVNTFLVRRALFRQVRPFPVIRLSFRADYLRTIWRFSVGMSATSIVALLMANADRAALTFYSSSSDIGRYSIAFAATGVLQMGIQPIYRTFFPRYAELVGRGEVMHLREEYYRSCRLLAVILIPIGTVTWLFAPELFRLWLGFDDATISTIFRYLLLGIVCAGMTWLPAAFQQAHGWTRLHALTIALPLFLGLPIMIYLIDKKGAVGATFLWVAHGVSAITVGLWFMHRRLLCGEFLLWYRKVVTPPAIAALSVAGISATIMPHGIQSFAAGIWVAVTGLLALLSSVWASDRFGRGDHAAPIKKM